MLFSDKVRIVEVGPRDGLQNEATRLNVGVKIELIERLAEAGLTTIEAGSFVSPKWVPQMAESAEVLRGVSKTKGVVHTALVPNAKGLDDALSAGADEVAVFASASEAFSKRNINCDIDESLRRFEPVFDRARAGGVKVRGYVSCALGCPYQGAVPHADVVRVAKSLLQLGCYEISLADTIGVGTPLAAVKMVEAVMRVAPPNQLALHFHDTYGQALANVLACLETGVTVFDAAVNGLGGCPYAKGATGNLATEDLVYMLDGMGVSTGVDLDRLIDASRFISGALGRAPQSRVARAMCGA